jgi:hypothetical protein
MNKCYDSVDNTYICEEVKINCLFADEVYKSYKMKRYGIKSCKKKYDENLLWDLKHLLTFNLNNHIDIFSKNTYRNKLYVEKYVLEQNSKGLIPDYQVNSLNVCNISNLIEKINSL